MSDNDTATSNEEAQDASAWKEFQIETVIWTGRVRNRRVWREVLAYFEDTRTEDGLLDTLHMGLTSAPVSVFRASTETDALPTLRSFFELHDMKPTGWTVWIVPPQYVMGPAPVDVTTEKAIRLATHCTYQEAELLASTALRGGSRCWTQSPVGRYFAGHGELKAGAVVCRYACTAAGVSATLQHPWLDCCPGESPDPEDVARVDGAVSALLACVCASDSMRLPHVFAEAVRTIEDALTNAD